MKHFDIKHLKYRTKNYKRQKLFHTEHTIHTGIFSFIVVTSDNGDCIKKHLLNLDSFDFSKLLYNLYFLLRFNTLV